MASLKILALSGSLRADSTNTALLRTVQSLAPAGVEIVLHDYSAVPLYNGDLDEPESVVALKAAIAAADGVLIATPEFNYSVPGVLKNAIDWASRPAYQSPFLGTPTGVVSAAWSVVGGARAQQHLKTILLGMCTPVFPWPEFLMGASHTKVTDGLVTDETSLKFLREYVDGFVDWIAKAKAAG